ncbi:MAG: hypothetical protein VX346_19455 [Planctomycetota bacterium]|nr:hypothetical protein [Planctomycetota bacterium]
MRQLYRSMVAAWTVLFIFTAMAQATEPIDIGSRRELFVDRHLIEHLDGLRLELHRPQAREVAIVHDHPWEGNTCFYHSVFHDGDIYRMYYRGSHHVPGKSASHQTVCYAESKDGVKWTKPELGIVEFNGSKKNNIIWDGVGRHNFVPFKDPNPNCKPDAKYKAIGGSKREGGLFAFQSADAIHWSLMSDKPVVTDGAFDSQNLAFWDAERGLYVDYHRQGRSGKRDIMTCTSHDFLNWTKPKFLEYPGAPAEHLYVNQIQPYFRAPHIYLGFPKRFVPSRKSPVGHSLPGVSDTILMSSRDGETFHRWGEAFVRPGPQPDRWVCRNNLVAWGLVETVSHLAGAAKEISLYLVEGYYQGDSCRVRRHTLRVDGFVSASAGLKGGSLQTRPLVFTGDRLLLNFSTSAAGSARVEIQDEDGKPINGFSLAECPEIFGDSNARSVTWKRGADLSALAGKPVRLRFELKDADLYSFQFTPVE